METLIRNATLTVSRRLQFYEELDQGGGGTGGQLGVRTWSRRKKTESSSSSSSSSRHHRNMMMSSFSYRRDRAKKRLIFLQSYKLSAVETPKRGSFSSSSGCWGMKKVLLKAKSAVMTPLSFARVDPFRWCAGGGCKPPVALCGAVH